MFVANIFVELSFLYLQSMFWLQLILTFLPEFCFIHLHEYRFNFTSVRCDHRWTACSLLLEANPGYVENELQMASLWSHFAGCLSCVLRPRSVFMEAAVCRPPLQGYLHNWHPLCKQQCVFFLEWNGNKCETKRHPISVIACFFYVHFLFFNYYYYFYTFWLFQYSFLLLVPVYYLWLATLP